MNYSPASNRNKRSRSCSAQGSPAACTRLGFQAEDDTSKPSNDCSRSQPSRVGGSGESDGSNNHVNGDDDGPELDVEAHISTPMASGQPMQQHFAAFLKSKDEELADLKQMSKASSRRLLVSGPTHSSSSATTMKEVPAIGMLRRMVLALFVSTSSSLTSSILIPRSTSSTCPPTRSLSRHRTSPD